MALIKCNECGKEISDKATTCIHCGCPKPKQKKEIEDYKNLIITNITKMNTKQKLGGILAIVGLTILLLIILNNNKPNIIGVWTHNSSLSGGVNFEKELYFKDKRNAILTNTVTNKYGNETIKEYNCIYKFRNNNKEIKISCDYDTEEVKEKNNIWVNFEIKEDAIYIDNDKYVHFSR